VLMESSKISRMLPELKCELPSQGRSENRRANSINVERVCVPYAGA
jgi:hypothetical protein